MKILLKMAIVLIMLPVVVLLVLYAYGYFLVTDAENRHADLDNEQEAASTYGNGYGGEPGLKVLDSGYSSEKFFWLDEDHLVFVSDPELGSANGVKNNFVWNLDRNEIKPLEVDGDIKCGRDGYVYYGKVYASASHATERTTYSRYRASLTEKEHRWVTADVTDISGLWPLPSDRHELALTDKCEPWFRLSQGKFNSADLPRHRFEYLYEWAWILRSPFIGRVGLDLSDEFYGVFDLEGEVYRGQAGITVLSLDQLPFGQLNRAKVSYVEHLDKYVIGVSPLNAAEERPYVLLLSKDGVTEEISWDSNWRGFNRLPIVSRLGVVWSGRDYRIQEPDLGDVGSFIRNWKGEVLRYVHGGGSFLSLSNDGCKVAQRNRPKANQGIYTLIVFDVCNSRMRVDQ